MHVSGQYSILGMLAKSQCTFQMVMPVYDLWALELHWSYYLSIGCIDDVLFSYITLFYGNLEAMQIQEEGIVAVLPYRSGGGMFDPRP